MKNISVSGHFSKYSLVLVFIFFLSYHANSQEEFWGVTYAGGVYNGGTIFKTDKNGGNYELMYSFGLTDQLGKNPVHSLIYASNGKLYGMTSLGGNYNWGTLFCFDPNTSVYQKIHDFNAIVDGGNPMGALMQASNGKIYGGNNSRNLNNFDRKNKDVIFELDITTNTFQIIHEFIPPNGNSPQGQMVEVENSVLYGMTKLSAPINNSYGVIYEFNLTTKTYTKKVDFDGEELGSEPAGSLFLANDGLLYGATSAGGAFNKGTLFSYNYITNEIVKLHDFDGKNSGSIPEGGFIQASDGLLYGHTRYGGVNNVGVLFSFNPANSALLKLIDFDEDENGYTPNGSLLQGSNGKLYGMTAQGKTNEYETINGVQYEINDGVLFEFNPETREYIKKFGFNTMLSSQPGASLITVPVDCTNSDTILSIEACEKYIAPDGQVFTSTGFYQVVIPNAASCDSIIGINLTISPAVCVKTQAPQKQLLIASASSGAKVGNYELRWSAGETVTQTWKTDEYILTQGFHQPEQMITSVPVLTLKQLEVYAFPNPVQKYLTIQLSDINYISSIKLYNSFGKLIKILEVKKSVVIDMENYASGLYVVNIHSGNKQLTSIKIIKTNR